MSFEKYINGIRIIDNPFLGMSISIDKNRIKECSEIIKLKKIKKIMLAGEYRGAKDISFLCSSGFSQIESITISSSDINNIDGLYECGSLKSLGISNVHKSTKIDFSKLISLRALSLDWSKYYSHIFALSQLQDISISKYPFENLEHFQSFEKLRIIELTQSKLVSLEGIETLKTIEKIKLSYNRNLLSLKGIGKKHKFLKTISIYNASKLFQIEMLKNATNLENISLAKMKEIDSFKFLDNLQKLKNIQIKPEFFKVKDEDFSPIERAINRCET